MTLPFKPVFKGLLMGTASVADLERSAALWRTGTDQVEIARHAVEPALRALWGVDEGAHPEAIVLAAPGAERGFLRLLGTTDPEPYAPDVADGRAPLAPLGYELLSRDVDEAAERIMQVEGFRIVGGPLDFDNGPAGGGFARAMRIVAPGGFSCLVNTIKRVPPPRELPTTPHLMGTIWNAPLTANDRPAVERFYGDLLGMPVILDGVLDQESIVLTNAFPAGWSFEMLVYGAGGFQQMIENEIHPADHIHTPPPRPGRLVRGNAVATLMVETLDPFIARAAELGARMRGPVRPAAEPYRGRRVIAFDGPSREMIELLEIG